MDRRHSARIFDRMPKYAVLTGVMLCVTFALFPITEPADVISSALDKSRILELSLLGLAALVITLAVIQDRCDLSMVSRAPLVAFLFCFWAMLTSVWSANTMLSFGRAGTLMMLLYTAVGLEIYARHAFDNHGRAISISMTAALIVAVAMLLLLNFVTWGAPFEFAGANTYTGREARLVLAHAEPLETGEFLSLAIVISALTINRLSARAAISGALFVMLVMTDSRNMMIFVPVALAVAWFYQGSTKQRFILLTLLVCGIMALTIFALSGDLAAAMPVDISTLNGRTPLWRFAWGVIAESPILGVGYYASRYYLINMFSFAGHAHNSYVETLMTTGLIGLSLLLVFLAYCIKSCLLTRSGLLTGLVVLSCLGSIFNPLVLFSNVYTFFLFVVLIVMDEAQARQSALTVSTVHPR